MYHYIDKNAALEIIDKKTALEITDKNDVEKGNDNQNTIPISNVINNTSYHDMGYDTPEEMDEEEPANYFDPNYVEKEFGVKKMKALSKLSERRKKNMYLPSSGVNPKKNIDNNTDDSELCLNDKETINISKTEIDDDKV